MQIKPKHECDILLHLLKVLNVSFILPLKNLALKYLCKDKKKP
jgi:hypothetical protein